MSSIQQTSFLLPNIKWEPQSSNYLCKVTLKANNEMNEALEKLSVQK